eukprot:scaffold24984_cov157-Isochrysis_galbana.AAC.1
MNAVRFWCERALAHRQAVPPGGATRRHGGIAGLARPQSKLHLRGRGPECHGTKGARDANHRRLVVRGSMYEYCVGRSG